MNYEVELLKRRRRLTAHIQAVNKKPCEWGRDDCTTWAASWILADRGIKIPVPAYSSREEAHALISEAGGLVNLWRGVLSQAGFFQTVQPQFGDVGVMQTRECGPAGFIMTDIGVAFWRTEAGAIGFKPSQILMAWSV